MRSEKKAEVLYGRKPVQLFLEKSPRRAARLYLDRDLNPQVAEKFSRLARGRSVLIAPVHRGQLDRMTRHAVHQGVAIEADPLRLRDRPDLLERIHHPASRGPHPISAFVALDQITDPQNFGAISRTAEAFGIAGLIFDPRQAPPLGGAAYKASAGALDFLPLFAAPNLAETLRAVKAKGAAIVGLDARATLLLTELASQPRSMPAQIVFVLGSEGRGIQPQIRAICTSLCSIPMRGHVGSLNVSAAAAAACFWWAVNLVLRSSQ